MKQEKKGKRKWGNGKKISWDVTLNDSLNYFQIYLYRASKCKSIETAVTSVHTRVCKCNVYGMSVRGTHIKRILKKEGTERKRDGKREKERERGREEREKKETRRDRDSLQSFILPFLFFLVSHGLLKRKKDF